jgi:hypothetical protein
MLENPTNCTSYNTVIKIRELKEQIDYGKVILILDFVKCKWKNIWGGNDYSGLKTYKEKKIPYITCIQKKRPTHRFMLCVIGMIMHVSS